jgi:hypothetical protein
VLRAVLQVEEPVADAAVLQDVDARPELGTGAVLQGAGQRERRGGAGDDLLAGEPGRGRVGDVVAGDVEGALVGEQTAERGLQPMKVETDMG